MQRWNRNHMGIGINLNNIGWGEYDACSEILSWLEWKEYEICTKNRDFLQGIVAGKALTKDLYG